MLTGCMPMGADLDDRRGECGAPACQSKPPQTCYRLRRNRLFWQTFVRSTLVLSWLTVGVQLVWGPRGPPEPHVAENHRSALRGSQLRR